MAARGPAPTPTAVLEARGSWRAKTRDGEMVLPVEAPNCPSWLNKEAKEEWKRVVIHLEAAGVLALADRALLTAYCEAWGEFYEAVTECRKVVKESGYAGAVAAGLIGVKNKAADRLLRMAQQFGLSPSARTRVRSQGETEAEQPKLAEFTA